MHSHYKVSFITRNDHEPHFRKEYPKGLLLYFYYLIREKVEDWVLIRSTTSFLMKTMKKKSESLQTEGRHFRSMICKLSDV